MAQRTVLVDAYSYMIRTEDGPQHMTAYRGETVELSEKEIARGESLGALGTPEEALAVAQAASEPASAPDEQLRGFNVDQLVVYLQQHPSEAERLAELEAARGDKQRKGVLDAIDRTIAARDEAIEDELARREAAAEADAAAGQSAPAVPSTTAPALPV